MEQKEPKRGEAKVALLKALRLAQLAGAPYFSMLVQLRVLGMISKGVKGDLDNPRLRVRTIIYLTIAFLMVAPIVFGIFYLYFFGTPDKPFPHH